MADTWTCDWMRQCIEYSAAELRDLGVIQFWDASAAWGNALKPCQACRSSGASTSHRQCRGWKYGVRGRDRIVFSPSTVNGSSSIRVTLEGVFSTQRPPAWTGDWRSAPMAECTAAVTLHDATTEQLLCRQHLDLANSGPPQPGPVWHLQLGGIGGGDDRAALRSVAQLRWPSVPIDFILVIEMCLFLFHSDVWNEVKERGPWRSFVKCSEDLILSHYAALLTQYRNQDGLAHSWLSAQCNRTGLLNPRPS